MHCIENFGNFRKGGKYSQINAYNGEMAKIFITGAAGLVGVAARFALEKRGHLVFGCDLRSACATERFDFRDVRKLRTTLTKCDGVLHLGALSRVIWGETHSALCSDINIHGTRSLMKTIAGIRRKIWLVFASSREVYGTPPKLPCTPDTLLCPENLYARTKLAGENMTWEMRHRGFCVAVVRLSNVFGSVDDYRDRVVPAFAAASASGGVLRLRGADGVFDFTPLSDTVDAIVRVIDAMISDVRDLPAIDIVTGRATSLAELARIALVHGSGNVAVEAPLPFYPARFQGDARPAKKYLGWVPQEPLENAVGRLVTQFKGGSNAHIKSNSWLSAAL